MDHLHSISNAFNVERLCLEEQKLLEQPRIEDCATTPTTLQSLPVEILLHMFSFLQLKPYIISHGVCKDWKNLLPLAEIHPTRRRLLALYHKIINTPYFERSLTWSLDNLEPFDRQAYIDSLLSQYPAIPEEFRMWILEWPDRLVIACMWPGIQLADYGTDNFRRRFGFNWLGYKSKSPQLFAVLYKNKTPHAKFIPGLLVWRTPTTTDWLIFAEDERDLFGRVYLTDFMDLESSAVIPHGRSLNFVDDLDDEADSYINIPYADWVSYLENHWEVTARMFLAPEKLNRYCLPDWRAEQPVLIEFDTAFPNTFPTFPWNLRDTISHLALFS
ncbi:hypothetical protein CVT25_008990 [Psilocybe cyanescens]|uniref:F-box domain-containing protein n=1 Tax=Psilocybe cyanescens TaxID=93625 RepID=A0A409XNB9_PSICY|nr:hypothetical protein CVT25_008990 [Psilocybe cyanescens]